VLFSAHKTFAANRSRTRVRKFGKCHPVMEIGYFFRALKRYEAWIAVLASALFRTLLHGYAGFNLAAGSLCRPTAAQCRSANPFGVSKRV